MFKHLLKFNFSTREHNLAFPMLVIRIAMGLFFAISGFYKLFDPQTHQTILKTMMDLGIPFPHFHAVFVPLIEFLGGLGLIFGFLTFLSALGLFIIIMVATFTEAIGTIPAGLSAIRWLDYFLYLPEVLYAIFLFVIMWYGPGRLSIDRFIEKKL